MKYTTNIEKNPLSEKVRTAFILSALTLLFCGNSQADDRYQYEVLLNPSPDILRAETRGRIMIYDGLENEIVELAMTEQFGRIENMMFVRTRYVQPDGDIELEEDGCD